MATDEVTRRDQPGIALLTLNRPQARNALSESLIEALSRKFESLAGDTAIKAIVLAAEGPVFCSGHDLKELTRHRADGDRGRAAFERVLQACSRLMQQIVRQPQPVIAAVEGTATAAGCQLVASCDLATAGEAARFCTPGVHIGLFCSTPMVALSRNLSRKHAMEMLLLGELVPAAEAARMGLVNRVVAPGQAVDEALALAGVIAAKSGATVRLGKRTFYDQLEMSLTTAYEHAAAVMVENMLARDAEEGIGAFLAKRQPVWDDATS